jgi:hypothetical protein
MQHLANITREGFAASMEIRPLLDQAGAISDLAEIFFKEWNRYDRRNRAEIEMQLRQNLNHDSLPITLLQAVVPNCSARSRWICPIFHRTTICRRGWRRSTFGRPFAVAASEAP